MRISPLLAGAFLIGATMCAAAKPIWDTYPILLCRYDKAQFCLNDMSSCKGRDGAAVLTFDFQKSEVRSFTSKTPRPISGRYFFAAPSGDINVVLAEATLFSFGSVLPPVLASDPPTIEGLAQQGMGLGSDAAFNVHMTCHPQP